MSEHHALRLAGRAGGELDEGRVTRRDLLHVPGARDVVEVVDQEGARAQPLEQFPLADLFGEALDALERAPLGVEVGRAQASGDPQ